VGRIIDLSLHLLDLLQNSAHAGARNVHVILIEDEANDLLEITVSDDGKGMSSAEQARVLDPFYTSSGHKEVGLGLPLAAQAAAMAGGSVSIESNESGGTRVAVSYRLSHPDRQPLGDVAATLVSFVAGNPLIDLVFEYQGPKDVFRLDTRQIRTEGEGQLAFIAKFEEKLRGGLSSAGYRPDRGGLFHEVTGRS
jgi:anti-sigma regulatory factor (Ser/Thr protein kinase)